MRIVGGKWAGRELMSPGDRRVRPTAEPVREAILGLLEGELEGARVLDLFAGTGALGLEAMSRGAAWVDFVESLPGSLFSLKSNVTRLRARDRTRIFKRDAIPFAEGLEGGAYDIAFADPPYNSRMVDRVVSAWKAKPFARILCVEHAAEQVVPPGGRRHRIAGTDTAVTVYRAKKRYVPPRPS